MKFHEIMIAAFFILATLLMYLIPYEQETVTKMIYGFTSAYIYLCIANKTFYGYEELTYKSNNTMDKAKVREFLPIGKIYTCPNGLQELKLNETELSNEQLNHILVRCADLLRARADLKNK